LDENKLYCYKSGKTELFDEVSLLELPTNEEFLAKYEAKYAEKDEEEE
jgi:hypothetical protein